MSRAVQRRATVWSLLGTGHDSCPSGWGSGIELLFMGNIFAAHSRPTWHVKNRTFSVEA